MCKSYTQEMIARDQELGGWTSVNDLKKGSRITGDDRNRLAGDLKKRYAMGASIRELATDTNRSYGFVHRILSESGAALRGRGGATRTRKTA